MEKRPRRKLTSEYKAEVVRLVLDGGKTVGQVSRELDLTESAVRSWVRQAKTDAGQGRAGALTTGERAELVALRREAKQLRMEREVLKTGQETELFHGEGQFFRTGLVISPDEDWILLASKPYPKSELMLAEKFR